MIKKPPHNLINSEIAYWRLVGAVVGALSAITIISLSSLNVAQALQIFALSSIIGRTVGMLVGIKILGARNTVEEDHAVALKETLKQLIPEEHIPEATLLLLEKEPVPILLRDLTWIVKNLPPHLKAPSKQPQSTVTQTTEKPTLSDLEAKQLNPGSSSDGD